MIITSSELGSSSYSNTSIRGTNSYVSVNTLSGEKYIAQSITGTDKWNLIAYTMDRFTKTCRGQIWLLEDNNGNIISAKNLEDIKPSYNKDDPKHLHDTCFRIKKDFDMKIQGYAKELQREHFCFDCRNKARFGVVITRLSVMLEHYFEGDVTWALKSCRKANILSADLLYIINNFQLYRKKGFLALIQKHYDNSFFLEYIKANPKKLVYDKVEYNQPFIKIALPKTNLNFKTSSTGKINTSSPEESIYPGTITHSEGMFKHKEPAKTSYPSYPSSAKKAYPVEPKEAYLKDDGTPYINTHEEELDEDTKTEVDKVYESLLEKQKTRRLASKKMIVPTPDIHAMDNKSMWGTSDESMNTKQKLDEIVTRSMKDKLNASSLYNQYFGNNA